jgi:6-phosphogluconolactonase (cycloisomerase 2 family)
MSAEQACFAYVGTYTSGEAPDGGAARGEGIYLFELDTAKRRPVPRDVFPSPSNPSWLAVAPDGPCLIPQTRRSPGP